MFEILSLESKHFFFLGGGGGGGGNPQDLEFNGYGLGFRVIGL